MSQDEKNARALYEYMTSQNLPNVKYFYTELADKYVFQQKYGKTPLQYAVELYNLHLVELLVDLGADIYETYTNELPVQIAKSRADYNNYSYQGYQHQYEEIKKFLETKNRDKDKLNENGNTPLTEAIKRKCLPAINYLISEGANLTLKGPNGITTLCAAIGTNDNKIIEMIVDKVTADELTNSLLYAIRQKSDWKKVGKLLNSGADFTYKDDSGNTELRYALTTYGENFTNYLIKALIKNNANLSYADSEGLTPLDISVKIGFNDATKLLIEHGVDPNSFLKLENEALLNKYMNDLDIEMTTFLIKLGADVKKTDKNNQCPLIKGLQMRNGKLLSLLLENGADPFCEHFKDTNLLSIAAAEQYFPVVAILLQKNPSIYGAVEEIKKFAETSANFAIYMKQLNIECSGEPVVPSGIGNEAAFPTEKGDGGDI